MRRVCVLMMNDISLFPPTINGINILLENNIRIDIYSYRIRNRVAYDFRNEKVTIKRRPLLAKGLKLRMQYVNLILRLFLSPIMGIKYDVVIAYNKASILPAYLLSVLMGSKLIYHSHDESSSKNRGFYKFLSLIETLLLPKYDLISMPQKQRAIDLKNRLRLNAMPTIVNNSPRNDWSSINSPFFTEWSQDNDIIIYQGGLGPGRGLENILGVFHELIKINSRAKLLLVGAFHKGLHYRSVLENLFKIYDLSDCVKIIDEVQYFELSGITNIAKLGFGVFTKR